MFSKKSNSLLVVFCRKRYMFFKVKNFSPEYRKKTVRCISMNSSTTALLRNQLPARNTQNARAKRVLRRTTPSSLERWCTRRKRVRFQGADLNIIIAMARPHENGFRVNDKQKPFDRQRDTYVRPGRS